jgi:hypothetical protein
MVFDGIMAFLNEENFTLSRLLFYYQALRVVEHTFLLTVLAGIEQARMTLFEF